MAHDAGVMFTINQAYYTKDIMSIGESMRVVEELKKKKRKKYGSQ